MNEMRTTIEEVVAAQNRAEDRLEVINDDQEWQAGPGVDPAELAREREAERVEALRALEPVSLDRILLPRLPLVRVKKGDPENTPDYLRMAGLSEHDLYVVLGEVAQQPGHIIVCTVSTGKVLGHFHTGRFEIVPPGEA